MVTRKAVCVISIIGCLLSAGVVLGNVVQLDMSAGGTNSLNYDAVISEAEYQMSYLTSSSTTPTYVTSLIGDHSLGTGSGRLAWGHGATIGSAGLPTSGAIVTANGTYQIANGVTPATGYNIYGQESWTTGDPDLTAADRMLNALKLPAPTSTSAWKSLTITLGDQAGQYTTLNILAQLNPYSTSAANWRARIQVHYTDATTTTIYETGPLSNSSANAPFGGWWSDSTDNTIDNIGTLGGTVTWTATEVAGNYMTTQGVSPSGGYNKPRDPAVARYLFDIEGGLTLDPNKTLDQITISLGSSSTSRNFDALVYGVNLTAVPEPATMGLLGVGLGALVLRRRKR